MNLSAAQCHSCCAGLLTISPRPADGHTCIDGRFWDVEELSGIGRYRRLGRITGLFPRGRRQ